VSLLVLALCLGGATAGFVITGELVWAGVLTAAAGAALVAGGRLARATRAPRLLFLDASTERILEGIVLGAIAWGAFADHPRHAAAALAALGAGHVAGYIRAKAAGLGFRLDESVVDRAVRSMAIAVGLLAAILEPALWTAAAWSTAATVNRAFDVARQPEAG
jgi:hypothetical protein